LFLATFYPLSEQQPKKGKERESERKKGTIWKTGNGKIVGPTVSSSSQKEGTE
jgi:hypothetical protein